MIISHSRQFIFVHIHKAGGTSLEIALDPYLAWNDIILGGSVYGEKIQDLYFKKYRLSKHSTVANIEHICGQNYIEEFYLFSLVRHPVSRLCSLYNFAATTLNKWASRHNIALQDVAAHVTPAFSEKVPGLGWPSSRAFLATKNFSEFIRHKTLKASHGFRTQTSSLTSSIDNRLKGHFLRLEDYPIWAEALGARLCIDFSFPHMNKSDLKLIEASDIKDDDRHYIESIFKEDYDAFGY